MRVDTDADADARVKFRAKRRASGFERDWRRTNFIDDLCVADEDGLQQTGDG